MCYSVLEVQGADVVRKDYCSEAWTGAPESAFGWWKTRIPEPTAKKVKLAPNDVLLELFDELADRPEQQRFALRADSAAGTTSRAAARYRRLSRSETTSRPADLGRFTRNDGRVLPEARRNLQRAGRSCPIRRASTKSNSSSANC